MLSRDGQTKPIKESSSKKKKKTWEILDLVPKHFYKKEKFQFIIFFKQANCWLPFFLKKIRHWKLGFVLTVQRASLSRCLFPRQPFFFPPAADRLWTAGEVVWLLGGLLRSPVETAALLALGLAAPSKASREIGGEQHLF